MENKDQDQQKFEAGQQGSGSSESRVHNREQQKSPAMHADENLRQNVAAEGDIDEGDISDLGELGQLSGRDDYAGGSGDEMNTTNTGEETDR